VGSKSVLAIVPLPPSEDIKLTKEQVELALSKYDQAETAGELKPLLADGRAKWMTIKAALEAPVVASAQTETAPELDVPTAAGVEEPEPVAAKAEVNPDKGWRAWVKWAEGFLVKVLGK
jgi:hypothetical protein